MFALQKKLLSVEVTTPEGRVVTGRVRVTHLVTVRPLCVLSVVNMTGHSDSDRLHDKRKTTCDYSEMLFTLNIL